MLTAYFGDIVSGHIGRIAFLGYMLLLLAVFLAFAFGLGLGYGLRNVLAVFLPLVAVLGFARMNLAAKRWRSIGLAGWPMSLGITVLLGLVLWHLPGVGVWAMIGILVVETVLPPARLGHAD